MERFTILEGHLYKLIIQGDLELIFTVICMRFLKVFLAKIVPLLNSTVVFCRGSSSLCRCVVLVSLVVGKWFHAGVFLAAAPKGSSSYFYLCAPVVYVDVWRSDEKIDDVISICIDLHRRSHTTLGTFMHMCKHTGNAVPQSPPQWSGIEFLIKDMFSLCSWCMSFKAVCV